jgi:hypothetical protein
MKATQSAIPWSQLKKIRQMSDNSTWKTNSTERTIASINSQWPVSTQMQTTVIAIVKLKSSAAVNRPQQPSDSRFPSVQGRMMY